MESRELETERVSLQQNDARPGAFFGEVRASFERAARSVDGYTEKFFQLGGEIVRLCFAGPALVRPLTAALEHLSVSPAVPALTICLFDSASTGVRLPPSPWGADLDVFTRRGEVPRGTDDRVKMAFQLGPCILSIMDLHDAVGIYHLADAAELPWYESSSPLRTILHWWFRSRGDLLVHAGAVGNPQGGVLLVGRGGAGKSTTALACLQSDLLYAADDYCLLQPSTNGPFVSSLYGSAKLNPADLCRFPHLVPALSNGHRLASEKAMFFLRQSWSEKLSCGFPIRAIVAPWVTGREDTALIPTPLAEAVKGLAASTIHQLPGADTTNLRLMRQLLERIPAYRLEAGTDLRQIPRVLQKLLAPPVAGPSVLPPGSCDA
jgi:hypothetical protein